MPIDLAAILANSAAIDAELAKRERNRMAELYPDTGPLRRELYGKHLEFFRAGAKYRQRALIAGNRCITPWTPVETDHAMRRCGELLGERFHVRSWDGGSRCTRPASGVFLKGIERAFRIHLDNGQWFDATRRHRVLTNAGWLEIGQLVHGVGGLHWRRTTPDSLANCDEDGRQCGGPLRRAEDSGPGLLPSSERAQTHGRMNVHVGEVGPIVECSHASLEIYLPASMDDPARIAALCAQWPDPDALLADGPYHAIRQDFEQFARECGRRQEAIGSAAHQSGPASAYCEEWPELIDVTERPGLLALTGRAPGQSVSYCNDLRPWLESSARAEGIEMFFPCQQHSALIGDNQITCIVDIGLQPILDFTVEDTHCYESGGVIHHNTGKSLAGAYEFTAHLTGRYPKWWEGRRIPHAGRYWAAGDTNQTVRDIIQHALLGYPHGTGMIPGDLIVDTRNRPGTPGAVEQIHVRHQSGKVSTLVLKSYDQRREAFQGTAQDGIWLDEECPQDIYAESLTRTMTTGGFTMLSFTPLRGLTPLVLDFLPGGRTPDADNARHVTMMSWDDAPHLTPEAKAELEAAYPPHQRASRTKGVPMLGSGAIYPLAEEDIVCAPFDLPPHWPRSYGMDVGWKRTAVVWSAWDRERDIVYIYDEHYRGEAEPAVHVQAVQARGKWIKGVIDPASRGRSQHDGQQLLSQYRQMGLDVEPADNAVEAGIHCVWTRLSAGKLKIFASCTNLLQEFRLYRRDEKGKVVKENDHLLDGLRYDCMSGLERATVAPVKKAAMVGSPYVQGGWMA